MKLIMAGISYKNTSVEMREKLSFSDDQVAEICKKICDIKNIFGCIIISTCNRTEIYISCSKNKNIEPEKLLMEYSGVTDFKGDFDLYYNTEVVYYIMELACGLKSQIIGESQIVGQINNALEISRKANCTDSVIDTLFRIAVSCGKFALTNAKITNVPLSSAYAGVNLICNTYSELKDKKCIIIGNGKMGKIAQRLMRDKGCEVFVTLRNYKHGNNDVIQNCNTINYKDRYDYINGADFVISATRSPHFTLTYDRMVQIEKMPKMIVDLAMPRDVESSIKSLTKCFNIDDLGIESKIDKKELNAVYNIIERYTNHFLQWKNYKMSIPTINDMKKIISQRLLKSYVATDYINVNNEETQEIIEETVKRTVDMILGSMKESILPETLDGCKRKLEERARF